MRKSHSELSTLFEMFGLSGSSEDQVDPTPILHLMQWMMSILPISYIYTDSHQLMIEYNHPFAELVELPVMDAPQPLHVILSKYPPLIALFEKTFLEQSEYRSRLVHFERKEKLVHLLVDAHVIQQHQEVYGSIFACREIDNLMTIEAQVLRHDKLATAGKMAAGIAHEIRNPLTSIRGFLQVLERDLVAVGLEKEQVYIQLMLSEIDRVNQLVNQMLLLAKPADLVLEMITSNEVIESIASIVQSDALLRNIDCQFLLEPTSLVRVDRNHLKQVLLNLVSNALDAMEDSGGGTLTIATHDDADRKNVHIDISDTGPGIPSYMIDRIFDAFFTMKEHGTGLGLAICQRIVTEFGGEIRVFSKGFGTTFSIILPAAVKE
ncbi:two-component system sensor histidine kinase NtrB [Sulfoacidibacillus thermotolerans]|uniref:histidine kinase n=1 Tax=Sulfoacidibacillus thermotolerans TaxID=1765684 RepID=A0A2U3D8C9_SULT2|nr:ATP-binding protein [Sulfoacidibacillus thermotolerans]PWI57538.1 hypothetical protein BM613_07875 [Sulfoacidibacillus thermotolerans]